MSRKATKRLREKTTRLRPFAPTGRSVAHAPSRKDRKAANWRRARSQETARPRDYGEPSRVHDRVEQRHRTRWDSLDALKAELVAAENPRRWWHRLTDWARSIVGVFKR